MELTHFDSAAFLRDYWQKQPLLIRNPWQHWANPLVPDELAGLACEDGVESRLITLAKGTWKPEDGPFSEKRFGKLGKKPWTLLVQAVDHYVPAVAALIEAFRFVPNWRVDDVMVSYAVDGGGVGAHFDHYDVFLVQGHGRRRWQVGGICDEMTPLLPHDDLRLLADFEPEHEWLLEPGDVLYVPPGFGHNGVAVGDDCMTYSIGFRAPSRSELIGQWCDHLMERLGDDDRYTDPDLAVQGNPGEILPEAIARLHAMVNEALLDRETFARWFGRHASTPKYPEVDWRPEDPIEPADLHAALAGGAVLERNAASRFAFIREGADRISLYVDGRRFDCHGPAAAFAERLCARARFDVEAEATDSAETMALIVQLFEQGNLMLYHAD
jgi:50S ribosomal protein L16 3-hydroxylase